MSEETEVKQVEQRTLWGNINFVFSALAGAIGTSASAINEVAATVEDLAATGHVMAKNNRQIVTAESNHNLEVTKREFADMLAKSDVENKTAKPTAELLNK